MGISIVLQNNQTITGKSNTLVVSYTDDIILSCHTIAHLGKIVGDKPENCILGDLKWLRNFMRNIEMTVNLNVQKSNIP